MMAVTINVLKHQEVRTAQSYKVKDQ